MSELDGFIKEVLADLQSTGEAFWDKMQDDQKPIVERAVKAGAKATVGLITEPERADIHRETLLMVKSTLESEATLSALRAAARLKESIQRVLGKLVLVGLSVLGI